MLGQRKSTMIGPWQAVHTCHGRSQNSDARVHSSNGAATDDGLREFIVKRCRKTGSWNPLLILAIAVIASLQIAPARAQSESPKHQPKQDQPPKQAAQEQPKRDTLRVSYPYKFSKESAYLAWVNQRATTLEKAADKASGVPRRIELLLAAANRLLASGTEHAASTRILGIVQEQMPDPADRQALFDRTQKLIDSASVLIEQHEESNAADAAREQGDKKEEPTENEMHAEQVWRELAVRRDTIQSFAQALRAYLFDTGSEDDARNKRRAASNLSTLLESDSTPIAASARLWQALLRSKEDDPSRALSIIGPVTAPPRVGSQPYRFYGAILRAQLLSKHQSPTLALAMLMRVEDMVETWFSGQRNRGQALRTSAFTRAQILQAWSQELARKDAQEEEVAWCQAGVLKLQEGWLTGEMPRLLRLSPAIPLLVAQNDLAVADPKPPTKEESDP